jgi:hypothetical protein
MKKVTTILTVALLLAAGDALAATFFNSTPRGEKPAVSPQLLIEQPAKRKIRAGPLTLRVAFRDLAYHPELRTPNAAATLGMTSQVTEDGRVRGHIHAYVQRIGAETNRAAPFCIFEAEHLVAADGYDGVAERECGALEPGEWRLMVDVNTDSHDGPYKAHPQEVPASDSIRVTVRDDDDDD